MGYWERPITLTVLLSAYNNMSTGELLEVVRVV